MKTILVSTGIAIMLIALYVFAADLPTQNIPRDSYDVGVSVLYTQNPDGTYSAVNANNPLPIK